MSAQDSYAAPNSWSPNSDNQDNIDPELLAGFDFCAALPETDCTMVEFSAQDFEASSPSKRPSSLQPQPQETSAPTAKAAEAPNQQIVCQPAVQTESEDIPPFGSGTPAYGSFDQYKFVDGSWILRLTGQQVQGQPQSGPMPVTYVDLNTGLSPSAYLPQEAMAPPACFVQSGNQLDLANDNLSDQPKEETAEDEPAMQGDNIEYHSKSGEVFKGDDVMFNRVRGYFLPLTSFCRDLRPKRSGPRPGTRDEPLYEVCKWHRGDKSENSECLGRNVYGLDFDTPEDWELPGGLGKIRYDKEGSLHKGFTLTARQIRAYVDNNPRNLRLMVANAPSQASHRMLAKDCIWSCCPNVKRNMRQGFHQVIFDEYPEQTDAGDRDPFRIAGRMHLWCYEQCCDIVDDFKCGRVKPETRQLLREERNVMALNRDCNATIERDTYEPWFRYQIQTNSGARSEPRPFNQSLAYVLTKHHLLNQADRRQVVRDKRNQEVHEAKSLDIHEGDLCKYHELDNSVSSAHWERSNRTDEAFQACFKVPEYRLPEYFGSKALGRGFVLDESLVSPMAKSKRKGKKRSRRDADDEDGLSNDEDECPQRPVKRLRRSPTPPSGQRRVTRANSGSPGPALPGAGR